MFESFCLLCFGSGIAYQSNKKIHVLGLKEIRRDACFYYDEKLCAPAYVDALTLLVRQAWRLPQPDPCLPRRITMNHAPCRNFYVATALSPHS